MKKMRLSITKILFIAIIVLVILASAYITSRPSNNQETATRHTITFDFDKGFPLLVEKQSTPFNQTLNNITALFSSPSDPAAYSIQSYETTTFQLSQFSGKYLYANNLARDILDIQLSTKIIAINFTFATIEQYGGAITVPSDILLIAYYNTQLLGSTKAYGSFSSDSYPQGMLSFSPGGPFNQVRISIPAQTSGTTKFLIDNITVTFIS